ncbi:MAG: non-ribosomal peptide synthetase, partial [Terriglobia bacterium]
GGEPLSRGVLERLWEKISIGVYNLYGPTEAADDATFWKCSPHDTQTISPIGRPIANTRVYVLDDHLRTVPIGVPGEMCIAGACLARGYLDPLGDSGRRFIQDPFDADPSARMFRTSDLVRYNSEGVIEFIGRTDHQVKVNGFRVELEEVEAHLRRHPAVSQVGVVVMKGDQGGAFLKGVVVPVPGAMISPEELRAFLRATVPWYMQPTSYLVVERLPVTATGKVDRAAIAQLNGLHDNRRLHDYEPWTSIDEGIAAAWSNLLGTSRSNFSRQDNFFEGGGHSLAVIRLVLTLRERFSAEISLSEFLKDPTPKHLATLIKRSRISNSSAIIERGHC